MLSSHSERIYIDEFDLGGLLKVLVDRIALDDEKLPFYLGAHQALNLIDKHDRIDNQATFMAMFEQNLESYLEDKEMYDEEEGMD